MDKAVENLNKVTEERNKMVNAITNSDKNSELSDYKFYKLELKLIEMEYGKLKKIYDKLMKSGEL